MENSLKKRDNFSISTDSDELGVDNRSQPMSVDGKNISASTAIQISCETNAKRNDGISSVGQNFGRLGVDVGKETEFPSSKTSVGSSDADLDDAKSTGSSHPFSSPNPSEYDDHGVSSDLHTGSDKLDLKRPYKRRKQLELLYTGRLAYPLSERKQMALLMQMTAPEQQTEQPKSPGSSPATSGAKVRGKLAKIHRRNDRGETSLHMFAKRGDNQQVLELIREGAEVNVVDYAGWTPLHEACNKGWYETAEILIKHGANVNACGLENDTPLHDAALNGNKNLVILLLRHGGDAFKANARNKSPLDVAEDKEIIELLKNGPPAIVESSSSSDIGVISCEAKSKPDYSFDAGKVSCPSSPKQKSDVDLSSPLSNAPPTQADVRVLNYSSVAVSKCETESSNVKTSDISRSTSIYSTLSSQPSRTSSEILEEYARHMRNKEEAKNKPCVDDESGDDQKPLQIVDVEPEPKIIQPATLAACSATSVDSESEARLVVVEDEETDKEEKPPAPADVDVDDEIEPIKEESTPQSVPLSETVSTHRSITSTPKVERPKRRIVPPMRTNYASVVPSQKKVENRGRKRKVVEKDVYEFHSSDSDIDASINESPLNANRRKLIKLTDQLKSVTLDTSDAAHNTSLDELNSTKNSSDSTIGYLLNKSENDIVSTASLDQQPMDIEESNVNTSKDDADVGESPKSDPTTPNGRGRSGSHGSATFSPVLSTTSLLASRKERLLGFRRRRGSHASLRYGSSGTNASRQLRIDDIVRNVSAGTENGSVSLPEEKRATVYDNIQNIASASSSSNLPFDSGRHKSDSDGHSESGGNCQSCNGAPKVPPLKLVLSNTVRSQITAEEEANRTYVVRSRAGSIDKREDADVASVSTSDATKRNGAYSSLNLNVSTSNILSGSPSAAVGGNGVGVGVGAGGGESTQRVTRSQVRLHGPNNEFIRRIEEAQAFLPKKRKLKQKTIEPVAASRHWKPVISMNLAGMASKNSFEAHHELRKTIEQKWQEARVESESICYTPPNGYNKFLLSKKSYLLRDCDQKSSVDDDAVPAEIPSVMGELYKNQENEREEMRVKHRIERERLILACETEAIRVHNRISRGTADPPMSAMRVLRDADVYNPLQLDKPIPFSYAALSLDRYIETCSMDDVLIRFGRSKRQLVGRQRLESDCLMATQFNEWTTKYKTINVVVNLDLTAKSKSFEKFCDRSCFPFVCVISEFDLLPQEFISS